MSAQRERKIGAAVREKLTAKAETRAEVFGANVSPFTKWLRQVLAADEKYAKRRQARMHLGRVNPAPSYSTGNTKRARP
jgi:hypothetical protein